MCGQIFPISRISFSQIKRHDPSVYSIDLVVSMPWTFSHPAVVFPIKQAKYFRWLSLPALILGSLSPDLFYSLTWYRAASVAHEYLGWFYTGLPLCILVYWLTQKMAPALNRMSPLAVHTMNKLTIRHTLIIFISLYIGALTHIVWDGFTHESGAFVREISFLQIKLFAMSDSQEIAFYKLLQHLGSAGGFAYLCYKYFQFHRFQPIEIKNKNNKKLKRLIILGGLAFVSTLPFAYWLTPKINGFNFNRFVYLELTLTVPVFLLIVLTFGWRLYVKDKPLMVNSD